MGLLSAILPVIIIIVIFFFIVRIATVILKLTGMDEKTARFQAISAFTGTGFTTEEAELMLERDLRRRTVTVLMILGKVGIVSMITGLFLSFGRDDIVAALWKVAVLIVFIVILYKITASRIFGRALNRFIEKRLIAGGIVRQSSLEEVFQLPKGYGIAQLTITSDTEEKGLTLADAGFIKKNILVLSIERQGSLISFPRAEDVIKENDRLLCYGLLENIKSYA